LSNRAIADWTGQTWIKVAIQSKEVGNQAPAGPWQYQEVTWMPKDKYLNYLMSMAQQYVQAGFAMRIGPSMSSRSASDWTEVVDEQLKTNTSFIQGGLTLEAGNQPGTPGHKNRFVPDCKYTQTMHGLCLVV
jgi:hypothetical protein